MIEKADLTSAKPLLEYLNKIIPLTEVEQNLVASYFKSRQYRKRQYVLQERDVCNQFNFVVQGCLRMYKLDELGNTHIVQFATEKDWMIDLGSFHQREPAELAIDALENTLVLQISYEHLIALYMEAPKFDRIFRVLIEDSYVSLQRRLLQKISSTAEERYLSFIAFYPHLSNRIPQTQIASFIGITPEFLSRLKAKMNRKS